jgi:hypothetical protein
MTQVCYTLEEAAEKLKLSETVLVRLSQYFKVPKAAYEEVGYLSFKGDLAFSDQDIAFFARAKDSLLNGASLDEVKRRVYEEAIAQPPQWVETPPPSQEAYTQAAKKPKPEPDWSDIPPPQKELFEDGEALAPIREIQDRKPYEKAAERSFERYKSMHRSGLSKVFENMLKEVSNVAAPKKRSGQPAPDFKPMREKRDEKPMASKPGQQRHQPVEELQSDVLLPFNQNPMTTNPEMPVIPRPSVGSWEHLIQEAASQPRVINTQLKNAAQILRQRATGAYLDPEQRSS